MNNKKIIKDYIKNSEGILKLKPAWVAKTFLYPGKRLGLPESQYVCDNGAQIMERWLCSVTKADSQIEKDDEGLSYLDIPNEKISVKQAIAEYPEIIGLEYSKKHNTLNYLIKLFDYGCRLPFHIHQMQKDLNSQGKTSKDEAYHFLDAAPGPHPETFIGIHPYIVKKNLQYKIFEPLLKDWKASDAEILKYSRAYYCAPGEGFYLKSGLLHAPGSVLTFEIQESSDVGGIFQPMVEDNPVPKSNLTKDVAPEDIKKYGSVKAALNQIDWEANIDPNFYEKYHLYPRKVNQTEQNGIFENWIFYGTNQFSGKRLILKKGETFHSKEAGVHNIFVWKGKGKIGTTRVESGKQTLTKCEDEVLVCHERAISGYDIINDNNEDLILFKIFGPDINNELAPKKIEQGLE